MKLNILHKIACFLVGWNPRILKECGETSHRLLKRCFAALIILIIIWGLIGWNFARLYMELPVLGAIIATFMFVIIITYIERIIILADNKSNITKWARFILAIAMALLGSTIFDHIMFEADIKQGVTEAFEEKRQTKISEQQDYLKTDINTLSKQLDSINNARISLYQEINETPTIQIVGTTTNRQQIGTDSLGIPIYHTSQTTNIENVPNPKLQEVENNQAEANDIIEQIDSLRKEIGSVPSKVGQDIDKQIEEAGFLTQLDSLINYLIKHPIAFIFYIIMFVFLLCIETLVLTITIDKRNCEYYYVLEKQRTDKIKELGVQNTNNKY